MSRTHPTHVLHLTTHLEIGGITSYLGVLAPRLIASGHAVSVLSSGGVAEAALSARGVRCVRDRRLRTKNELHPLLLAAAWRAAHLAGELKVDVLHAHTRVAQMVAALAGRLAGIPVVTTAHGFFRRRLSRRLIDLWGERVIAISPMVARELEAAHGVSSARVRTVANAVEIDELAARTSAMDRPAERRRYGIPERAVVVGSVSRLVADKGHAYLLDAVAALLPRHPDLYVVVFGEGREREALEKRCAAPDLRGRARIVAGAGEAPSFLSTLDLFVHPATYREGFGLSIAEAMAVGRPVIATDIWAVNTILKDGVDALLARPADAASLASKIGLLLEDTALARRLTEAGGRLVRRLCSPERMARETVAVYREALDDAAVRGRVRR
ncbi:MAG: D-inositol-3-phosphate glycosyltransferase [Candidatus Omnitrophica bacterium]|nr:D-inositol-3-phosphate glycosyltransferase [Candidatus Omnitrophota bacterium]